MDANADCNCNRDDATDAHAAADEHRNERAECNGDAQRDADDGAGARGGDCRDTSANCRDT